MPMQCAHNWRQQRSRCLSNKAMQQNRKQTSAFPRGPAGARLHPPPPGPVPVQARRAARGAEARCVGVNTLFALACPCCSGGSLGWNTLCRRGACAAEPTKESLVLRRRGPAVPLHTNARRTRGGPNKLTFMGLCRAQGSRWSQPHPGSQVRCVLDGWGAPRSRLRPTEGLQGRIEQGGALRFRPWHGRSAAFGSAPAPQSPC